MQHLVGLLDSRQVHLGDVRSEDITVRRDRHPNYEAAVAQALVDAWIARCPEIELDKDIPRWTDGLHLRRNCTGIVVEHEGTPIFKYHGLAAFSGRPLMIEVQKHGVANADRRIPRGLGYAERIYGRPAEAVIFCGASPDERSGLVESLDGHPVSVIALPYAPGELAHHAEQIRAGQRLDRRAIARAKQAEVDYRRRRLEMFGYL